ncbi:MAG: hypothetical protein ACP5P2_00090 [Candidatus Micrarchaeia archaeon]|jgi:hypothetical protein
MKYYVSINKHVRNIKVYRILKRFNQNTNKISELFGKFVDKYIAKKKGLEE